MRKHIAFLLLIMIMCGLCPGQVSDFTSDSQGWTIFDAGCSNYNTLLGSYTVNHTAAAGDTGGYIGRHDPSGNCFFFAAPAEFLGNQVEKIGGALKFSLRSTMNNWTETDIVVLVGNGLMIVAPIGPLPATSWTRYAIPLTAATFHYNSKSGALVSEADFAAVMSNLTALRISAEFGSIIEETTDLDSVALVGPDLPADFDHNCRVDLHDCVLLFRNWLNVPQESRFDLHPDNLIDYQDLTLFVQFWLVEDPDLCAFLSATGD